MKAIYSKFGGALALTFAIFACVPQPRSAPPAQLRPVPTPAPAPARAPAPAPVVTAWMDVPITLGDWRYRPQPDGGVAEFGTGSVTSFRMRCDAAAGSVLLTRLGVPTGPTRMTVRTESQSREVEAIAAPLAISARLSASDRLLDAMALSKGRFAIEVSGTPPLYLPSWAEVTRVIEDCR